MTVIAALRPISFRCVEHRMSLLLSMVPSNDKLVCNLISNFSFYFFHIEHYVNLAYQ